MSLPRTAALVCAILVFPCVAQAGKPPDRETADWIAANMHDLNGKVVAIRVASIDVGPTAEGKTLIYARTVGPDDSWGGSISVVIPNDRLKAMVRDYGTSASYSAGHMRTRRLSALMRIVNGFPRLYVD